VTKGIGHASAPLVALAPGLLLLAACGSAQSGVDRALQRMRDQPRANSYGASPVFADGMVMRAPPAGTVAREAALDPAAATGRDAAGRYVTAVPVPVTPALLATGRSRFRIFCGACHGPGGFGGSIVAENMVARRPPSLRAGAAAALPAGMLYEVIRGGFGRMPSYAGELAVPERWAVVAYALSIRGRAPADSAEREDSARAAAILATDSARVADSLRGQDAAAAPGPPRSGR
jgi:mono/diheme cytochrome c family protein